MIPSIDLDNEHQFHIGVKYGKVRAERLPQSSLELTKEFELRINRGAILPQIYDIQKSMTYL